MRQQFEVPVHGRGTATPARIKGVDQSPEQRPGVPREAEPRPDPGAHWSEPERQPKRFGRVKRKGLEELTPVYGSAQPLRGISGLLRRFAYRRPEHEVRHWAMLLTADRVDVLEDRVGRLMARPFRGTRLERVGRAIEHQPVRTLVLAGGLAFLASRALR